MTYVLCVFSFCVSFCEDLLVTRKHLQLSFCEASEAQDNIFK